MMVFILSNVVCSFSACEEATNFWVPLTGLMIFLVTEGELNFFCLFIDFSSLTWAMEVLPENRKL